MLLLLFLLLSLLSLIGAESFLVNLDLGINVGAFVEVYLYVIREGSQIFTNGLLFIGLNERGYENSFARCQDSGTLQ